MFLKLLFGPILFLVLIIVFVLFLMKQFYIIRLEKRFDSFSLLSTNDFETSIFDDLILFICKIIHKLSNFLNKSVMVINYGKKYDRYIHFEDKIFKSGLDYVSLKFLIGFVFIILTIFTSLLQNIHFQLFRYLLSFIVGFFLPDFILYISFKRKRKKIEDDLLKAVIIMNNCFKSGRNIMQAIAVVKEEMDGPLKDEFQKIYLDITYGLSLDVVFNRFYDRVKLEDIKYIASSLTLLNKTGGNIIRVFSMIEKSIFDKKKLRKELNSLISSSVFVFRVLVILPFLFVGLISILNPTYFTPFFTSFIGYFFLFLILFLFIVYVYVISKVLKVKI